MRDPHVEQLKYQAGSSSANISYLDPTPLSFSNDLGTFDLVDGQLTMIPREHFASEEEAKTAVESFLKSWEVAADLKQNPGTLRFRFQSAQIIDRDPPPHGSPIYLVGRPARALAVAGTVSLHVASRTYPPPPVEFSATNEVQLGHRRWLHYRDGNESLQSMAYFVLTLVLQRGPGIRLAAQVYSIEEEILRSISRLSSTKGDALSARKATTGTQLSDLTGPERAWLEQAVRSVLLRLGQHAAGVTTRLTLRDLPPLR